MNKIKKVFFSTTSKIKEYAFSECFLLQEIKLPSCAEEIVAKVFYKCGKIISITIPESIRIIDSTPFEECKILQKIEFPYLFLGTNALNSFIILNFNQTLNWKKFKKKGKVNEFIIPNYINEIGEDAFSGCKSITNIIIPNSVTEICK